MTGTMERLASSSKPKKVYPFMGISSELIITFSGDSRESLAGLFTKEIEEYKVVYLGSIGNDLIEWIKNNSYRGKFPFRGLHTYESGIESFLLALRNNNLLHRILYKFEGEQGNKYVKKVLDKYDMEINLKSNKETFKKLLPHLLMAYLFIWINIIKGNKELTQMFDIKDVEERLHYLLNRFLINKWR